MEPGLSSVPAAVAVTATVRLHYGGNITTAEIFSLGDLVQLCQ